MNKKISEIGDRAKTIFKLLVENYISTGEPLGSKSISSKINNQLSPATIRNVLNEINFYGLIQKDHFSAGSVPTDFGLQFYTQALLEPGKIHKNEKDLIDSTKFQNLPKEYEKITSVLNGLSNQASLVINDEKIPKIKKIDFHKIDNQKVIFIIENDDGSTTNRLVETKENIDLRDLNIVSEFLNKFTRSQSPVQIEKNIFEYQIENTCRSVGTRLSHYLYKKYGDNIVFNFIDMGWKKEVLESIKESIQIEAFPEIIFLSKYVGDYNITKFGNKLVFENNGHCVVLKRDEII